MQLRTYGHPGSFNPAVIANKEARMIDGDMNNKTGYSQNSKIHASSACFVGQ